MEYFIVIISAMLAGIGTGFFGSGGGIMMLIAAVSHILIELQIIIECWNYLLISIVIATIFSMASAKFEMDVEDYYFQEQRKSRKWALENESVIDTEYIGELPFSNPRTACR